MEGNDILNPGPQTTETAQLVAAALRGEEEAFALLVKKHLRAAYLAALAIVGRPSDAEDVVQVAFLRAFERLDSCRDASRFSGWLLRIVRNGALNWARKRTVRERGTLPAAEVVDAPATGDCMLRTRLLAALGRLKQPQREVVLLHDLEGLTHPEIARALEISEVMSRQHLFVARRRLREQMDAMDVVKQEEVEHGPR